MAQVHTISFFECPSELAILDNGGNLEINLADCIVPFQTLPFLELNINKHDFVSTLLDDI